MLAWADPEGRGAILTSENAVAGKCLWRQARPSQLSMDGLLQAILIQFAIQAQPAVHGNQRGNDSPTLDEVKSLTNIFVVSGQHVHKMEVHPSGKPLFIVPLQLLNLVCIRRS